MIRIFGYLAWRSIHNRAVRQLRRLRTPRYLIALVLGLAYLWIIVVRPRPAAETPASTAGIELVAALALAGAVTWAWLLGLERRVLAFSPAEVTFLFSAPVSRRGLIQYKLLRSQLVILFNSLLWTLLLSRERFGASPWLRAISIWVVLTTLSLHRLGASFVRASLLEHGRVAVRYRIVSLMVVATMLVALAWSLRDALPGLAGGWTGGAERFLPALSAAARRPVPGAMLFPFMVLVHPLTAPTPSAWLHAIGPAALLLGLHYVWVLRGDTAFEEAAAEVSLGQAKALSARRESGSAGPRLGHRTVPRFMQLAPVGWPAGAILWKNLLAVLRTRRLGNSVAVLGVAGCAAAVLSFRADSTLAEIAGWLAAMWAAVLLAVGPQWVRNDLRGDLPKLDLLRSYPLRGPSVVAAETGASTLVLTAMQLAMLALAYLAFLGNVRMTPPLEVRTLLLGAAVVCLPGINFVGMLIHNGAAILFPAWVQLGAERSSGVEVLGQSMLMIVVFAGLLGLALLAPTGIGGSVFLLLRDLLGRWALAPATAAGLALLGLEALVIVRWLGAVFERTDPASALLPS